MLNKRTLPKERITVGQLPELGRGLPSMKVFRCPGFVVYSRKNLDRMKLLGVGHKPIRLGTLFLTGRVHLRVAFTTTTKGW